MARYKISDLVRRLNIEFGGNLNYQTVYLDVAAGDVPAERDDTGRFWLIDEADEPRIAKFYGLLPAKLKAKPKPAAKPKPTAKPKLGTAKPARSRTTRSAA